MEETIMKEAASDKFIGKVCSLSPYYMLLCPRRELFGIKKIFIPYGKGVGQRGQNSFGSAAVNCIY
jgi:hypothetical protein